MSDLMAKCDWYDGTLSVVLPEDPERIAVRMFDSRLAPARLYVPEVETLTFRDENAKLRELVKKIEHYEQAGCHECPYADGCEAHTLYDEKCPMSREIERMKRELGFEVD